MARADTGKAIGKVTKLLQDSLSKIYPTTAGRPEPSNGSGHRLNIFLYEALFDSSLKNTPLDEGQPAPIWLVLKYLLTAFDDNGESDTAQAHEYLGEGVRALQELNFLFPNASTIAFLGDNPEPLKISFDETPSDLLSKIMQGSDEKYRFSIGFQVRPVMIAMGEPPSYNLLVGVDYTKSPLVTIGEKGVKIPVIPSMGPTITSISPSKFEVGSTLTIFGSDLNLFGLSVMLGSAELAVTAQRQDRLECFVDGAIKGGGAISAGSHPVSVVQILPTGRRRSSNLLVGNLLPDLSSAEVVAGSFTLAAPPPATPKVFGNIDLTGRLLATKTDDILVALYKDGHTVRLLDEEFDFTVAQPPPPPVPPLSRIRLKMKNRDAVTPGKYRIILRINGQQAKNSPEVNLIV